LSENLPLSEVKVVLIDDSNTIRRSGEMFLKQSGCNVVLAEDVLMFGQSGGSLSGHHFRRCHDATPDGYQTCA